MTMQMVNETTTDTNAEDAIRKVKGMPKYCQVAVREWLESEVAVAEQSASRPGQSPEKREARVLVAKWLRQMASDLA